LLEEALDRWFTGAVARVECGGELVYERAFGSTRNDGPGEPVFVDTRFDLASLTKIFVATAALDLVARGLVALDTPLRQYLTEWSNDAHAPITHCGVRSLPCRATG
jgi:D-alanyl-D-alanine carboxypeptidase